MSAVVTYLHFDIRESDRFNCVSLVQSSPFDDIGLESEYVLRDQLGGVVKLSFVDYLIRCLPRRLFFEVVERRQYSRSKLRVVAIEVCDQVVAKRYFYRLIDAL